MGLPGVPLPKAVPHTITTPQGDVTIWGDHTKLIEFFPTATENSLADKQPVTSTVKATTVHRYPGDPSPYTRASHSRTVYPMTARSNGTTPGLRFWCELPDTDGNGNAIVKAKQFTYQGTFAAVRFAAIDQATKDYVLRNNSGRAYDINHTP